MFALNYDKLLDQRNSIKLNIYDIYNDRAKKKFGWTTKITIIRIHQIYVLINIKHKIYHQHN